MLMTKASQAVSSTDLQKRTRELLDRVVSGEEAHFVVMRDNKPAAIIMATERFEALIEELEDLRTEAIARDRLKTPREDYLDQAAMDRFIDSL
ncbi:MAG: type II toxin-antitoxin system Phd/YefM family antitoxin [Rhizobiaceae bacterium]|nr:type II toxin-antitoxin system Phd/YefM family antitoxin [Rhizobiaceae bacterium]